MTGAPVRSMRILRAGAERHLQPPGARRRHRGQGEYARLVPAAPGDLQGEAVAPALVVGHPRAAERREAGLGSRGTTTGGSSWFPPGADEGGGDGGAVRGQHQGQHVYLALVAVPLRRDHRADRDGQIPAARRTAARLRGSIGRAGPGLGGSTRASRSRAGQAAGVVQAADGQRAGELRGQVACRGPAEHARLPQGTQHRADPVQADLLRRLAARLEVLVQPPVPGRRHRAAQLSLGQQAYVGLGARVIHQAGRRPGPTGRSRRRVPPGAAAPPRARGAGSAGSGSRWSSARASSPPARRLAPGRATPSACRSFQRSSPARASSLLAARATSMSGMVDRRRPVGWI